MRLYLNEKPRTFIIVSNEYALIVKHPFPEYHDNSTKSHNSSAAPGTDAKTHSQVNQVFNKVIVEFVSKDFLNLSRYRDITPSKSKQNKQLLGLLGFLNLKNNIFLGFITGDTTVASPTLGESVHNITSVDFYCLNNDEFDVYDDFHLTTTTNYSDQSNATQGKDYPTNSVRKLLTDGTFNYSPNFDITSNIQGRGIVDEARTPSFQLQANSKYFGRFMWNKFMNAELIEFRNRLTFHEQKQFDKSGFLITVTRGYAKTVNTTIDGNDALLTLITRQSCAKSGQVFGNWGCDDNGQVANYSESEVIVYTKRFLLLYVIVKGNVPIHWEVGTSTIKRNLITTQKGKHLVLPRSFEASTYALSRHFDILAEQYGEVHVIDALSQNPKTYKGELNQVFKEHINRFNVTRDSSNVSGADLSEDLEFPNPSSNLKLEVTDIPISTSLIRKRGYTAQNIHSIVPLISNTIIDFGALFYDNEKQVYIGKQLGVFRVTSFDSLSKANYISKIIAQEVLELACRDYGIDIEPDMFNKHALLWSENDHYITKIVEHFTSSSKTKPNTTSTKKAVRSHISKMYLHGVVENRPNETAMLKLLGRMPYQVEVTLHNPIHDYVNRELSTRTKEFSFFKDISLFASTFNVNGHCYDKSIRNWLFPSKYDIKRSYDLVFIGIQEIVELTPGKLVNTDLGNRLFWEKKINRCLDKHNPENVTYISLWSGQIGGIALFLYIKNSEIKNISNLEGSYKKTGLGGMSANKGGVAVSFNYSNTEICFVSSHLAAGLNNTVERHHNYKTIAQGVQFSKNRRIKDHDVVVWLGDFNYRIGLPNEQVKPLIKQRRFAELFEYDQLNTEMANGGSFPFFDELEIKFVPTYKFDNGTKNYDTSEKQRIPAWTDRVISLSRKKILKQLVYDCDEDLIFSDHRPVYAMFKISVNIINEQLKKNISNELYDSYKQKIGDINEVLSNNNFMFSLKEEKVLPPPSSELNKWWLEAGKPAKISIPEMRKSESCNGDIIIINPRAPINPFDDTNEPEFISKEALLRSIVTESQNSDSEQSNEAQVAA
jgi:inositol-1,4,5-trisphosphate 5-phosphatase